MKKSYLGLLMFSSCLTDTVKTDTPQKIVSQEYSSPIESPHDDYAFRESLNPGRKEFLRNIWWDHSVKVLPGDTLWSLAESFYGDGKEWTRIREDNPFILDPNIIPSGERILIYIQSEDLKKRKVDNPSREIGLWSHPF